MSTFMPVLETRRLQIRPFVASDLPAVSLMLTPTETESQPPGSLGDYLSWSRMCSDQFPRLDQPPFGDRAVIWKETLEVIGIIGLVPAYGPFGQLPGFLNQATPERRGLFWLEFGLYYHVSDAWRGRGIAVEASQALIDFIFTRLQARRVVATTTYDNRASQKVMQRLGMRIEHNPLTEPAWFQVVGILDHP